MATAFAMRPPAKMGTSTTTQVISRCVTSRWLQSSFCVVVGLEVGAVAEGARLIVNLEAVNENNFYA